MEKNIILILIVVELILLIPLFGNIFIDGWNWGVGDFIVMGALLFGTGLLFYFAMRNISNAKYRILACISIIVVLLCIWVELAVDGVSQILALIF